MLVYPQGPCLWCNGWVLFLSLCLFYELKDCIVKCSVWKSKTGASRSELNCFIVCVGERERSWSRAGQAGTLTACIQKAGRQEMAGKERLDEIWLVGIAFGKGNVGLVR